MKTKPLFTFIQIADPHYEAREENHYPGANASMRAFLSEMEKETQCPLPDFFVITGDLTGRGSGVIEDLEAARQIFSRLPAPRYLIPGNHDLAPHRGIAEYYPGMEDYEEVPLSETQYARIFGPEELTFSFERAGVHLFGFTMRDEDPDGMVAWIEDQLAHPRPKLIFGHYPLYVSRTAGAITTWEYTRIGKVIPLLKALFSKHQSKILAYIAGHLHINSVVVEDGVRQILTGALAAGVCGYRYFKVFPDRIEVKFYRLQGIPLEESNFMLRKPDDIDETHPSMELYNMGTPGERDFSFSVKLNTEEDEYGNSND